MRARYSSYLAPTRSQAAHVRQVLATLPLATMLEGGLPAMETTARLQPDSGGHWFREMEWNPEQLEWLMFVRRCVALPIPVASISDLPACDASKLPYLPTLTAVLRETGCSIAMRARFYDLAASFMGNAALRLAVME